MCRIFSKAVYSISKYPFKGTEVCVKAVPALEILNVTVYEPGVA
jgi:hypothetical protein